MAVDTQQTQPILVPIDLAKSADSVLEMAIELAESLGRPLVVLHVVHDSGAHPGQYLDEGIDGSSMPLVDLARLKLEGLLSEHIERHADRDRLRDARVVLVDGLPANRILEVAEREHPKMIVMGSHGRNGVSRALIGSVAEAVTRASQVPVTIIKTPGKA